MISQARFAIFSLAFAVAAASLEAPAAFAAPVSDFDITGVKLMMTPDEALAALREKHADLTSLKITHKPCVKVHQQAIAQRKAPDASEECVLQMQHVQPGMEITYYFVEDYPANPGTTRVFAMEYYQYDFTTPPDRDAFRTRVVAKYGKPDVLVPDIMKAGNDGGLWCEHAAAQRCFIRPTAVPQYPVVSKVLVSPGYTSGFDALPLPQFHADPNADNPIMSLQLDKNGADIRISNLRYGETRIAAAQTLFNGTATGTKTSF